MTQEKLSFIQKNAPCYLYERRQITDNCQLLKAAMPGSTLLYSIKANPFLPVVKTIAAQGFGADAASANEVLLAHEAGIPAELIFYSAPGKTAQDIEITWGKCTVIADSFSELKLLEDSAAKRNEHIHVGLRVNPGFSMDGADALPSKFGIDEEQLTSSELNLPHLDFSGIHVHLRSQILNADTLCAYYKNCYRLAERISTALGSKISFINFGSGIGTVYDAVHEKKLDLEKIKNALQELQELNEQKLKAKFIFETGRFPVCNAGSYYTKVIDRKVSRGKTFLIVQNALNGFIRPSIAELLRQNVGAFPSGGQEPLYTSGTQCSFRILGNDSDLEKVDVVGNLCTSLDVLVKDIMLPHAEVGDILEVTNAGSYGYTLTPQLFSGHNPVKELLWES